MSDTQPYPLTNLSDQGERKIVFLCCFSIKVVCGFCWLKACTVVNQACPFGGLFVNTTTVPFTTARVSSERNVSRKNSKIFGHISQTFSRNFAFFRENK